MHESGGVLLKLSHEFHGAFNADALRLDRRLGLGHSGFEPDQLPAASNCSAMPRAPSHSGVLPLRFSLKRSRSMPSHFRR